MRGDLSFVSGQVKALESRLLTPSSLDRMVGAANFDEAFAVLLELQYSEYIDDSTKAIDFETIIERGLLETKELLQKGADQGEEQEQHQPMNFLWLQFDVNNLKRALRIKLQESGKEITEFTEENGFSRLGVLSKTGIEEAVFNLHAPNGMPLALFSVVENAESIFEKTGDFTFVEYALDKALGEFLYDLRDKTGTHFYKKLVRHWVDVTNYRNLTRSLLLRDTVIPKEAWIEGANIAYYDIEKIKNISDLVSYTERTKFAFLNEKIDADNLVESVYAIEQGLDHFYMDYLKWESVGAGERLSVIIHYFERRIRNAQMLKFVMYAKFHGVKPEAIYKRLAHF